MYLNTCRTLFFNIIKVLTIWAVSIHLINIRQKFDIVNKRNLLFQMAIRIRVCLQLDYISFIFDKAGKFGRPASSLYTFDYYGNSSEKRRKNEGEKSHRLNQILYFKIADFHRKKLHPHDDIQCNGEVIIFLIFPVCRFLNPNYLFLF